MIDLSRINNAGGFGTGVNNSNGEKAMSIKERVTVSDALSMYSPDTLSRRMGNRVYCPICHSKGRDMQIWRDHYKCFSGKCGAHGDAIDLVKQLFGLNYGEAVDKLNNDFSLGLGSTPTAEMQAAFQAAVALRERREAQRREAAETYDKALTVWAILDRWERDFPPGDPRHDTAERDRARARYTLDCAEDALNQFK